MISIFLPFFYFMFFVFNSEQSMNHLCVSVSFVRCTVLSVQVLCNVLCVFFVDFSYYHFSFVKRITLKPQIQET